ncbi:MAG: hypothetical protein AAF717_16445 [Bacteroidota bacterium]
MPKKLVAKLVPFAFCITVLQGQETKTVLNAPENWRTEMISFPLSFAPEIDFTGFEDIRFTPGWADRESEQFWTYHFVWFIDKTSPITTTKLTEIFGTYYDGLMTVVLENGADSDSAGKLEKTQCSFTKTDTGFEGKIRVFDAFFTKAYITLYLKVEEAFCEASNKQVLAFDISPKRFDHKVWQMFNEVTLLENCE